MKKVICLMVFLIPSILYAQQINVISFNIRLNTPKDSLNAWPHRINMVTGLLQFHEAEIFGLQEALHEQILDIEKEMPDYEWFGAGRDDGEKGGEFNPVFFKKSDFTLLDKGTFWLSETPDKPSKGWDAAINRVVTWGKFRIKETGKEFFVYNTHFDHVGKEARKNSAELIRKKVQAMNRNINLPVIITGDFNLTPETEPVILLKKHFKDSREISLKPPYGPVGTFNGFNIKADLSKNRIDYIFLAGEIEVLKYAALSEIKDQRFPSDHIPVYAKVRLK